MASNHEAVLWIARIGYTRSERNFVFRTRAAARKFADEKYKLKSVWFADVRRATWGPEQ